MDRPIEQPSELQAAAGARRWVKPALALAVLVALILGGRELAAALPRFAEWVDSLGALGVAIFGVGYAAAVVAFVPASLLTLAAGALFGVPLGTAVVFVSASAGACAAFAVARYAARGLVERRVESNARFAAIDRAVASEGLKITTLLRLSPVFPFNLLNYALGLTRVRFGHYALACLGMLPGTFLYVYLGAVAGDLATIAAGEGGPDAGAQRWITWVGLAVTAVVTIAITRIARRALATATASAE
ncbi:MAG: TVP38/TMEM64 family protein [Myxococcota bacterium]